MAYATRAQLAQFGLPSDVLATISTSDQDASLEAISAEVDQALRVAGFGVPLTTWDTGVSLRVSEAAAYHLLCVKGFQPDELDANIRMRYEDFLVWKGLVATRKVLICEQADDATPSEDEYQPLIYSEDDAGW